MRPWPRLGALLTAGVIACAPASDGSSGDARQDASAGSAEGVSTVVRGFVVLGPEVRSFKPCQEDRELPIVPHPDLIAIYDELAPEPSRPVFVEVEGRMEPVPAGAAGAQHLTVTEVRRAAPARESRGCDEDLSAIVFQAAGQEPFWRLEVSREGLVYSTPDLPRTTFAGVEPSFSSGSWTWESTSTGPEPLSIRATFVPERCRDTMVGAVYGWSAVVELFGEERRGCAWQGDVPPA